MLREEGVDDLRNDRVVESNDAGEQRLGRTKLADQVFPNFTFNAAVGEPASVDCVSKLAEACWMRHTVILARVVVPLGRMSARFDLREFGDERRPLCLAEAELLLHERSGRQRRIERVQGGTRIRVPIEQAAGDLGVPF